MNYVTINGRRIAARMRRRLADGDWDNRESWSLTMEMSNQEAAALFSHDAQWGMIQTIKDTNGEKEVETDMRDFSVAGTITDNRNGTVTVKMGELTDREALEILIGGKAE